jgi:hypothetical protein
MYSNDVFVECCFHGFMFLLCITIHNLITISGYKLQFLIALPIQFVLNIHTLPMKQRHKPEYDTDTSTPIVIYKCRYPTSTRDI